ncbi:dihydroorotase [cyanobiont of Ornithocercus magnificus]|nr:dihydroorotase [cyanobiont of Ornithocercus magnificus]
MVSRTENYLSLRQPDDWHVHLRDHDMLAAVAWTTARVFARAIVMPNLQPPITTVSAAVAYRERIIATLPFSCSFRPLMTAYLTEALLPQELEHGYREGVFTAAKLYPVGVTTNSDAGVRDLHAITPLLNMMQHLGMPLLVHGEVNDPEVDIFDREAVFIERYLAPLIQRFPELPIVLEHITTEQAVSFVMAAGPYLAATITPHHLHINRNAMFQGGFRSDFYCLPVAKREHHRLALRYAATSGLPSFFLGTDSAPHPRSGKESSCGCAGIYNAPHALESYAMVFEEEGALDRLEGFASIYGARFYGLPLNATTITLERKPLVVPKSVSGPGQTQLVPFHAGQTLPWRLLDEHNV